MLNGSTPHRARASHLLRPAASAARSALWTSLVGLGVCVGYIAGNVGLLHAMRIRSRLALRVAIVSNFSFATGLTLLMILGAWYAQHWDASRIANYVGRSGSYTSLGYDKAHCKPLDSSIILQRVNAKAH